MIDRCYCGVTHNAIEIGGVIIVVDGEQAFMHHGGYQDPHSLCKVYGPIEVPWRVVGGNMIFSLRGWSCRIMQVIESAKLRYVSLLVSPYFTTDGEFTIDWSNPMPGHIDHVDVVYA